MSNFCSECGRENNESAKFCVNCGDSLTSTGAPLLDNRYRIVRTIKSGGMGCVYKAKDTRLDIWVALKKMLPYHRSHMKALVLFVNKSRNTVQRLQACLIID